MVGCVEVSPVRLDQYNPKRKVYVQIYVCLIIVRKSRILDPSYLQVQSAYAGYLLSRELPSV